MENEKKEIFVTLTAKGLFVENEDGVEEEVVLEVDDDEVQGV